MRYLALILSMLAVTAVRSLGSPIITGEQAFKLAIYAPHPLYPLEAKARNIAGHGTFILHVIIQTGLVRTVDVEHSTGSPILDFAAVSSLKKWRFKPGSLPSIKQMSLRRTYAHPTEDSLLRAPIYFRM